VIYLFCGENEFEKRRAIAKLIGNEKVARHDGEDLTLAGMQEIAIGQTLFMNSSVYLISRLSENSEIWSQLPDVKFDDDRTIILISERKRISGCRKMPKFRNFHRLVIVKNRSF